MKRTDGEKTERRSMRFVERHRRVVLRALTVVALLLVMLVGWLRREARGRVVLTPEQPTASPGVDARLAGPNGTVAATAPPDEKSRSALPFRITDVSVDKQELCRGESTVVRVKAAHDEGKADWLVPIIGGTQGWSAVYRVPSLTPGLYNLRVSLTDPDRNDPGQPQSVTTSVPIELEDCDLPVVLEVTASRDSDEAEIYRIQATARRTAGPDRGPVHPASYVWTFDDGSTRTTREAEVRHQYPSEEARPRGTRLSSYLVKVEAKDASGASMATGRVGVTLRNTNAELLRRFRTLQLVSSYPRGLSPYDEQGESSMDVTLKNLDETERAKLASLEFRLVSCNSDSARTSTRSVKSVFSDNLVEPRGVLAGRLRWQKSDGVCAVDVRVAGVSEPGGFPVVGAFSMRMSVGKSAQKVSDPAVLALLQQASEASGGTHQLSLDDLRSLAGKGVVDRAQVDSMARGSPWTQTGNGGR